MQTQKFQDFEEERIDYTKNSLWTYTNIASTVCVSDDEVSIPAIIWDTTVNRYLVIRENATIFRGL